MLCCVQVLEALLGEGFPGVRWGLKFTGSKVQVCCLSTLQDTHETSVPVCVCLSPFLCTPTFWRLAPVICWYTLNAPTADNLTTTVGKMHSYYSWTQPLHAYGALPGWYMQGHVQAIQGQLVVLTY